VRPDERTCLVPPLDAPTVDGDEIEVVIDGVGTTLNTVVPIDALKVWWRARLLDPLVRYQP
jgi:hypothetical protein